MRERLKSYRFRFKDSGTFQNQINFFPQPPPPPRQPPQPRAQAKAQSYHGRGRGKRCLQITTVNCSQFYHSPLLPYYLLRTKTSLTSDITLIMHQTCRLGGKSHRAYWHWRKIRNSCESARTSSSDQRPYILSIAFTSTHSSKLIKYGCVSTVQHPCIVALLKHLYQQQKNAVTITTWGSALSLLSML